MAAEVLLRSAEPDDSVPVGLRDRLAAWFARRPGIEPLVERADAYRTALSRVGTTDEWASFGAARLHRRRLWTVLLWVLMVPYALLGLVAWGAPAALTWAVSRIRLAPAVMATVLPLAALVSFGLATLGWWWFAWGRGGFSGVVTATIVLPITFAALGLVTERGLLWVRWLRNRVTTLGGRGRRLADLRAEVLDLAAGQVDAAFADPSTPADRSDEGAAR
jgi:hypothetical protein